MKRGSLAAKSILVPMGTSTCISHECLQLLRMSQLLPSQPLPVPSHALDQAHIKCPWSGTPVDYCGQAKCQVLGPELDLIVLANNEWRCHTLTQWPSFRCSWILAWRALMAASWASAISMILKRISSARAALSDAIASARHLSNAAVSRSSCSNLEPSHDPAVMLLGRQMSTKAPHLLFFPRHLQTQTDST